MTDPRRDDSELKKAGEPTQPQPPEAKKGSGGGDTDSGGGGTKSGIFALPRPRRRDEDRWDKSGDEAAGDPGLSAKTPENGSDPDSAGGGSRP